MTISPAHTVAAVITVDPVGVALVAPNPVVLNCSTLGVPTPDFTWTNTTNNGTSTVLTNGMENVNITTVSMEETTTSILTIEPSQLSDTASYVCSAENLLIRGNPVESSPADVIVIG